jgi:PAS domain S-box-containing protein
MVDLGGLAGRSRSAPRIGLGTPACAASVYPSSGYTPWLVTPASDLPLADLFRDLMENARQAFCVGTPGFTAFHYVSPAYATVYGRSPESLIAAPGSWLEAVHPDDRPRIETAMASAGADMDLEYRVVHPDGAVRWVRGSVFPVRDGDGRVVRWVAMAEDVSDVRQALAREQEARRAAERAAEWTARLQAVTAALSEVTSAAAGAKVILTQALAALGANAGTVCLVADGGRELEVVGSVGYPEAVVESWRRFPIERPTPISDAVRSGEPVVIGSWDERLGRYPHTMPSDRGPDGPMVAMPLVVQGRTIGGVGFVFPLGRVLASADLAFLLTLAQQCAQALERARLHEAERRARLEAEAANRAKDDFLAILGHELRNPLAPVLNAAEVLRLRGDEAGARVWAAEVVTRQARHMARLVDDLLDVARVARGTLELRRETVDLCEVARRAVEALRPALDRRRHRLSLTLPPEPVWLEADPARLEQVLANLLDNAAKYTPEDGSIEVVLRREAPLRAAAVPGEGATAVPGEDDADAVITVRDEGDGIAPEALPWIFDPFRQGQPPGGPAQGPGGLGIGLSLARRLVELHGGTITAASGGHGSGSSFTVRLPAHGGGGAAEAPQDRAREATNAARRVLLVEDNPDSAEALRELLLLWGHEVEMAADGPTALAAAPVFQPDVVLLDIGLPGMDGYEVARALRRDERFVGLLLVALTGFGQAKDKEMAFQAGIDLHFTKPVDLAALEKLLARRGTD